MQFESDSRQQLPLTHLMHLISNLTYIMQKELSHRSSFFLESPQERRLGCSDTVPPPAAGSIVQPDISEHLRGVNSLCLHWDSTDSQVLGSEGEHLAGRDPL